MNSFRIVFWTLLSVARVLRDQVAADVFYGTVFVIPGPRAAERLDLSGRRWLKYL